MKRTHFLFTLLFLAPCLAQAHGYWIELKGSGKVNEPVQVQLFFGEYSHGLREKGATLGKMSDISVFVRDADGNQTPVVMTQTDTHWQGEFTPKKDGYYQILGLNDKRDVQDWTKRGFGIVRPVQYLRADYVVGNTERSATAQVLDVVANPQENTVGLRVFKDKKAYANTSVRIVNPDGWERVCDTNEQGRASFVPNKKGLYVVELEWIDKTPGTFNNKPYDTIRHRCDVTFVVD
ncbi:DUF4198 domain-containing protein [Spirosoma sp. BT702]|uniref:DUF4198 domain-containing protein n=1 Tax=Spirosoma profusum TaxID=2771354 RepID=A0A926XZM4_9BACT|nr:DUF4198 domain-containing protein [Spirosoma profusum]MBD2699111.1 DUF4198 domain-containing protein [Spirosoma profusum]